MKVIDNQKTFVEKAFRENNIAVVLESSQYFIPYLDVMLKSMVANISLENNYDVIILGSEIDEYDEKILKKNYEMHKNVSIRFFNPQKLVKEYIEKSKHSYLEINYYRMALPWILSHYDKAVQLGADIVLKRDIADLYNMVFGDKEYLAGVRDLGYLGRLNMDIPKEELGMKEHGNYVNADVLVYDLEKIRRDFILDDVMRVWQTYKFRCSEQDALNLIFDGKVKILDSRWNVFPTRMVSEMHIACSPKKLQEQRKKDMESPYLVHFAAIPKPWEYPMVGEGIAWWEYARESVYYEEILRRLMIYTIKVENSIGQTKPKNRCIDKLLPVGSKRRAIAKRIIPRDSARWNLAKKVQSFLRSVKMRLTRKNQEEKYGKLGS